MAPLVIDQNSSRSPTDVGQIPYKNVGHRSTSSAGECTGANSTLNKGVAGLPLRASAVVGYQGGEREERKKEMERGKRRQRRRKREKLFGEGEHSAL